VRDNDGATTSLVVPENKRIAPYLITDSIDNEREGTYVAVALAAIRTAGLDPIWDAAVRLKELSDLFMFCPNGHNQLQLIEQTERLCCALDKETDDG
jgi:hypothetical protein